MPIKYEIINDAKLVMAVGSGVVTTREIIDHLDSLAADPNYIAPMKKLVDYRLIESIEILPEEAVFIAQKKKEFEQKFAGEKCAFVSPGDLPFGKARVHQALVDDADINTGVFRSLEEAVEWLDISLDNV